MLKENKELKSDHIAVKIGIAESTEYFKKRLKTGRVLVEECLEKWSSTNTNSILVASSVAKSKIKEFDGKRFLLIQIGLEDENKPFKVKKKEG